MRKRLTFSPFNLIISLWLSKRGRAIPESKKMGIRPLEILLGKINWGEVQVLTDIPLFEQINERWYPVSFLVALVYMHLRIQLLLFLCKYILSELYY